MAGSGGTAAFADTATGVAIAVAKTRVTADEFDAFHRVSSIVADVLGRVRMRPTRGSRMQRQAEDAAVTGGSGRDEGDLATVGPTDLAGNRRPPDVDWRSITCWTTRVGSAASRDGSGIHRMEVVTGIANVAVREVGSERVATVCRLP
jgi:hypothetical protein